MLAAMNDPLSATALWKRPLADGIAISVVTFPPPPDWPKIVTFPASPPKLPMLSRTHCSDCTRSSMLALPDWAYFSPPICERSRNPNTFRRWFMETRTTSCSRARRSPSYGRSSWLEPEA